MVSGMAVTGDDGIVSFVVVNSKRDLSAVVMFL